MKRGRLLSLVIVASVALLALAPVFAATLSIVNTTPGGGPQYNGSSYTFTVRTDTNTSDSLCLEYSVNNGAFTPVEGVFVASAGFPRDPNKEEFTFRLSIPGPITNASVQYQFFRADAGTGCNSNRSLFTGFSTFSTTPTGTEVEAQDFRLYLPFLAK